MDESAQQAIPKKKEMGKEGASMFQFLRVASIFRCCFLMKRRRKFLAWLEGIY
jgi:hypothetical protein